MESKTYFFRARNLLEILGDYKKLPPQDEKSGHRDDNFSSLSKYCRQKDPCPVLNNDTCVKKVFAVGVEVIADPALFYK